MVREKYGDCCVVCGEYVSEGTMVCKHCTDSILCGDVVFKNVKQHKKKKSRAIMGNRYNKKGDLRNE